MSRHILAPLADIVAGILLIVLSGWFAKRYVESYDKTLKWLWPFVVTIPFAFWWVGGGIVLILIELVELAGFLR